MGNLSRHASSPAGELANLRFTEAAVSGGEHYPNGAMFIGSDEPHLSDVLAEAIATSQPLVIAYPDGRELIGKPGRNGFAFSQAPRGQQTKRSASA